MVISAAGTGIGCAGFLFIAVVLLLAIVSAVPGGSTALQACAPSSTTQPEVVQASLESDSIPENYLELYGEAGDFWNVPWEVLAGIGWVETKHGTYQGEGVHSGENYAGAGGPMQFLAETFAAVAVDGDDPPDGVKSRYDPDDAIFSAAKLLKVHIVGWGASDNELRDEDLNNDELRRSIYSYNHSWSYVDDVLAARDHYERSYDEAPANYAGVACAPGDGAGSPQGEAESFGQRIAYEAAYYARKDRGTPPMPTERHPLARPGKGIFYAWGGGDIHGPGRGFCCSPGGYDGAEKKGFDCSGLVQRAVYAASNEKIVMPRVAVDQLGSNEGVRVSRDELAPGDLVFFGAGVSHVAIYYGEFNGKRWMVEAPETWLSPGVRGYVRFSDFETRGNYVGALRVTPPAGMESEPPDVIRAMSPVGAGIGAGAM